MNDVLITFGILMGFLLWRAGPLLWRALAARKDRDHKGNRTDTRDQEPEKEEPEEKKPEEKKAWFEWLPPYTLLFVGIGYMLYRTACDFQKYEVLEYDSLSPDKVSESLGRIPDMTLSERERLAIHDWLKQLALTAPWAGVLAAICVAVHAIWLACKEAWRERGRMSYEADLVLMVITMPLAFALMAMRAEARILSVMTGSAWQSSIDAGWTQIPWPDLKASEMSMYTAELQEACIFQCFTMWNIGALCFHYMKGVPKQYRHTLKWAGLQGIGFNILAAIVVSAGDMLAPTCALNNQCGSFAAWWQKTGRPFLSPILMASSVQCIYNVVQLGYLAIVQAKLPGWWKRMMATKALVLGAQFQLQLIQAFIVGSWLYNDVSAERAALLHAVLLNFECLLVVIANGYFWGWGWKQDHAVGNGPMPNRADVHSGHTNGTASMMEPFLQQRP